MVYIMANKKNGAIYTGVTAAPFKRMFEHRHSMLDGFTKRYDCKLLVFFELYQSMKDAIAHEKQIKGWSRERKIALIESINYNWLDLYDGMTRMGPYQLLMFLKSAQGDEYKQNLKEFLFCQDSNTWAQECTEDIINLDPSQPCASHRAALDDGYCGKSKISRSFQRYA
jgi:predicted GIY-YIG superfamily endonuclease